MVPLYPALQVQPDATLVPVDDAGHDTALQLPAKNGGVLANVIDPEYPASHVHPATMLLPVEDAGHATALHDPL